MGEREKEHDEIGSKLVRGGSLVCLGRLRLSAAGDDLDVTGGPAWTNRGGGAFDAPHGKGFYAVGIGTSKNAAMRRKQSDNRARVELAKVFNSEVTSLFKDYLSTVSDGEKENFEENSEEASQVFTDVKLAGVQIVDHWVSGDGTEYALAYLNMDAFGETIDTVEKLSKRPRRSSASERCARRVGCAPQGVKMFALSGTSWRPANGCLQVAVLVFAACAHAPSGAVPAPPTWVKGHPSTQDGRLYTVARGGPTGMPSGARKSCSRTGCT